MTQTHKAALPNTLKKRNYLSILNTFRGTGELSANDVAERTGISRATVMKAVNHFIGKGLLESAGKGMSTEVGGKKPELFRFCMKRYLICVGLSGAQMVVSVYDLANRLIGQRTERFCKEYSAEQFLNVLQKIAEKLLEEIPQGKERLYGVSLFIGGVLEMETGTLQYSLITPEWGHNVPLKQLLKDRFPDAEIVLDNVARMSACAAVLDNAEYEQKRVAVLYTDVGVSGCYIDKGHVLHGPNGMVGEIGPMVMALPAVKPYEKNEKCYFSSLIAEETICQRAYEQEEKWKKSELKIYGESLTLRQILETAERGDLFAQELVREAAWIFGAALHNVVLGFDPEVVILQGNYAYAGEYFETCVREAMKCFPRNIDEMSFSLKYDRRPLIELQMMGATKVLMRKFFSSPKWL